MAPKKEIQSGDIKKMFRLVARPELSINDEKSLDSANLFLYYLTK